MEQDQDKEEEAPWHHARPEVPHGAEGSAFLFLTCQASGNFPKHCQRSRPIADPVQPFNGNSICPRCRSGKCTGNGTYRVRVAAAVERRLNGRAKVTVVM